jgi:diguanylate cyclase (GGDEF)-like protein/PAS domain S-box-containing protein
MRMAHAPNPVVHGGLRKSCHSKAEAGGLACPAFNRIRRFHFTMPRFAVSLAIAGVLALAGTPGRAEESIVLQLKWLHAYQFAGYYVAREKGFYREAGLDVDIREGWPGIDFVEEVVSGRAQYGTGSSGLILDRNQGKPVVALAVILQQSPDILMAAGRSGITTPRRLAHKRVMTNYSTPAIAAMLLKEAGSLDKFEILDQTDDLQGLIDGNLDAVAGYLTDQPFFFLERRFPIIVIRPVHYGVDFYGDNLFTSEDELHAHPERVKAFRHASLKGWRYAMDHPDETVAMVRQYGSTRTVEHLLFEYRAMRELMLPALIDIGHMNPRRWRDIADTYVRLGQLSPAYSLQGFLYDPNPAISLDRFKRYAALALFAVFAAAIAIIALLRFNRRLQREIRERKNAELRLRKSEQCLQEQEAYLRAVFDNEPECIKLLDREGRLLDMNPAGLAMLGADSLEAVRGRKVSCMVGTADKPLFEDMIEAVFRGESRRLVFEAVGLTGVRRHLETHSVPLWDSDRRAVRALLGVTRDVSERLHTEEKLRLSAAVVESTREGVLITDADSHIMAINRAFTEITGYQEQEVIGRKPSFLASGRHGRDFYQAMWSSIRTAGCWQGELWNRRKDGELFPEWLTINVVKDADGRIINYVGVFSDISQLKRSQNQLEYLAHHDPLTGLPNRLLLNAWLEHALLRAERNQSLGAILFLDLDRFKHINDSLGHSVGDELLIQVANRFRQAVRRDDAVARLGGDEFTVLLENIREGEDAALLAEKLINALIEPFSVEGQQFFIGVSIGISIFPQDGNTVEQLLRNADAAMYRAKEEGRNTYRFYKEEMTTHALAHIVLQGQLRQAIERRELLLHYQPQVDLDGGRLIGLEALVRWEHPERGLITPAQFIPLAEDTGLILPLGEWVLRNACAQGKSWLDRGVDFGRIAVNIADQQLQRGNLYATVRQALEASGLPAERLELEITENFVMKEAERACDLLRAIRNLGVTLTIDDFGTGYSSLAYLKLLPVDKLKIDKSFVRDLPHDENDAAIARAVIALGHSLQFTVIAEGVETQAQRERLLQDGCDKAQGYLYGRPMPADRIEKFIGSLCNGPESD